MAQRVRSYVRQDGTRVRSHIRNAPSAQGRAGTSRSARRAPDPVIPPQRSSADAAYIQVERARILNDKRVGEGAEYCADIVKSGAIEATADRVAKYASGEVRKQLERKWRAFRCRWLNELAQAALDLKSKSHELTGDLIVELLPPSVLHRTERVLAKELIKKIPLPTDAKLVAVAHGLQIMGVALCVAQGTELKKCACFGALVLETGKEATKRLLTAEGDLWMRDIREGA